MNERTKLLDKNNVKFLNDSAEDEGYYNHKSIRFENHAITDGTTNDVKSIHQDWGGTPGLRKLWSMKLPDNSPNQLSTGLVETSSLSLLRRSNSVVASEKENIQQNENNLKRKQKPSFADKVGNTLRDISLLNTMHKTPGLIIAITLNLFLSMSFGQAFFPSNWSFPSGISSSIGVQMWLFSTFICQLILTLMSDFPSAMGMMMVENIPFMHVICNTILDDRPMSSKDTLSTIFVTYGISSIIVGLFFYLFGKFNMGTAVYFFPRHVIIGCIGGIGIFITQTGAEVATNEAWHWSESSLQTYMQSSISFKLLAAVAFEIILRIILSLVNAPLFPPFYFVCIPPLFYSALYLTGNTISVAHQHGWFFPIVENSNDVFQIFELIDFRVVNWSAVSKCLPTIIALTLFSLMHVPINIPSLSMSTKLDADINKELIAHGYSNLLCGLFGGVQNYLCYSNSLLYFKCNGGGIISGLLLSILTAIFFCIGPSVVYYMPRVMPGCLLLHIGIDLTREALWDSWGAFDGVEYFSIWAITIVMTGYGMTAGLGLGVICAAMTFTIQASRHVNLIRGKMCARTFRSSKWRTARQHQILDDLSRHILVIQLQGYMFFGNATKLAGEVERMLSSYEYNEEPNPSETKTNSTKIRIDSPSLSKKRLPFSDITANVPTQGSPIRSSSYSLQSGTTATKGKPFPELVQPKRRIKFLILDFTLVVGIDSSAAETITKIYDICSTFEVRLVYSIGSPNGFPCVFPLTERLLSLRHDKVCTICLRCSGTLNKMMKKCPNCLPTSREVSSNGSNDSTSCYEKVDLHLAEDLNEGLAWCEDTLLFENRLKSVPMDVESGFNLKEMVSVDEESLLSIIPLHLRQLYSVISDESDAVEKLKTLLSYFYEETIYQSTVMWRLGEVSDRAILVVSGTFLSVLEEEADTTEEICCGHLVGEFGLLNRQRRLGSLLCVEDAKVLVLSDVNYEKMRQLDIASAFILSRICMGYLRHRVMHVANRIWESHCIPV